MDLLPPANEVWGKVKFYTCVSFCSQGRGGLGRPPRYRPPFQMQTSPPGLGRPPGMQTPTGWADAPGMQTPPGLGRPPPNTVNKRLVRILLECILVFK